MFKKQEIYKKKITNKIIKYLPKNINILGLGTGSTIKYFINILNIKNIKNIISSSIQTNILLKKYKYNIINIKNIKNIKLNLYIDSADQVNYHLEMIKGGGKALTNEKIIANFAKYFICIVDKYKVVNKLGDNICIPIEIISPSIKYLIKKKIDNIIIKDTINITEYNNIIINIYIYNINNYLFLENILNNIPGIITVGLFIYRKANLVKFYNKKYFNIY